MAFKARNEQTIAIGQGTMTTALSMWIFCCVLLLVPLLVSGAYAVWWVVPPARTAVEEAFPQMLGASVMALGTVFILQTLLFTMAGLVFAGPSNRFRDHLRALAGSHTAWWCVTSTALT